MNVNPESQAKRQAYADMTAEYRREKRPYMAMCINHGRMVVKILADDVVGAAYALNDDVAEPEGGTLARSLYSFSM